VQGNVHCSKHIELASKAIVVGDLHYNMIEMVLGSEVNGKLVHITAEEGGAPRLSEGVKPVEQLDLADSEQS
jgi:cytoskeletal protein CcmA (bactofilin family)